MVSPPRPIHYLLLVLLAICWGISYLFIKVAVETIPPVSVAAGRIVFSALLLAAIVLVRRQALPPPGRIWWLFLLLGLTSSALPFTLIGWGEERIDSGLAAILVATVPFFTILLGEVFTRDEKLTAGKLAGILLGLVGVMVLVGPEVLWGLGGSVWRELAVVVGALSYAVTNLLARGVRDISPLISTLCTLVGAGVWAVSASLLVDRPWALEPSLPALVSVVILAVVGTVLGYLIFFRLVAATGAGFISLTSYLVPVVGVVAGALFLDETVSWSAFVALALILAGIGCTRLGRRQPSPERPASG